MYQNLAFMSYVVPTFYPTPAGTVQPAGNAPAVQLSNPDLQARAQRFLNVLFWTQQQFQAQSWMTDKRTLKFFQAPEFYFRSATPLEVGYQQFLFRWYWAHIVPTHATSSPRRCTVRSRGDQRSRTGSWSLARSARCSHR